MQNHIKAEFKFYCNSEFTNGVSLSVTVRPRNIKAQALMLAWIASMTDENHQSMLSREKLSVTFLGVNLLTENEEWMVISPAVQKVGTRTISDDLKKEILEACEEGASKAIIARCLAN